MHKYTLLGIVGLCTLLCLTLAFAQNDTRVELTVPRADSGAITIDGVMNEAAWNTAAHVDMITSTGFNIFTNNYGRPSLTEPDYQSMYARLLWAKDTLYVFMHIQEIVNDSSGLYWDPNSRWDSDQLFISISTRMGVPMGTNYDCNAYAAPEGPYQFLILGDRVTLNNGDLTNIPPQWRKFPTDTQRVFNASDICRSATFIDTTTGTWNVEMAIYNANITAGSSIAFNIGGSQSSLTSKIETGDSYAYYCWQPNVPDNPYAQPPVSVQTDPGSYSLVNSDYWAVLNFAPGTGDETRATMKVPRIDPAAITIDGLANETFWANAAKIDMVTSTGFNIFANNYGRPSLTEPDYQSMYARLAWAPDTLYVFMHIQDIVNDSSGLYWDPNSRWDSDQLFLSLSTRLGMPMGTNYDCNAYAAPEGPYQFLVLGPRVTLNNDGVTNIPPQWRRFPTDTQRVFLGSDISRFATFIDTLTGVWNVEVAIYQPNIAAQAEIGFNIGGSQSSLTSKIETGDSYSYYDWQPNVPDNPYAQPPVNVQTDPGSYNLVNSDYWAVMKMDTTTITTGVPINELRVPNTFVLWQNFPNPFNPSTKIQFSMPRAGKVALKVYNVLGQLVATLANEQRSAGTHEVQWNASHVATGVYIYQMTVDNKVVGAKKMMLLK